MVFQQFSFETGCFQRPRRVYRCFLCQENVSQGLLCPADNMDPQREADILQCLTMKLL